MAVQDLHHTVFIKYEKLPAQAYNIQNLAAGENDSEELAISERNRHLFPNR
jgi:hypothetical protein